MTDLFEEGLDAVAAERGEVLKAFLAKHKCAPDDVEQVHRMSPGCGTARRHSGPVPHRCPHCKQEVSIVGRVNL